MLFRRFQSERDFLKSLLDEDAYIIDGEPLYLDRTSKIMRFVWGDNSFGLSGLVHFEVLSHYAKVKRLLKYPSHPEL